MYKLTNFNIKGLAEPIRLLFSYGGIDFIDNRVDKKTEWPKLKETTPFSQVPVLEFEGKTFHQSAAICRYLARKVNLDGVDEIENLEIDSVVDTLYDLRTKLRDAANEKDEKIKEEKRKNLKEIHIPFFIGTLDKIAEINNGHLALKRLTWADLFFAGVFEYYNYLAGEIDLLENAPNLQRVVENVFKIDAIAKWIEIRPFTKY